MMQQLRNGNPRRRSPLWTCSQKDTRQLSFCLWMHREMWLAFRWKEALSMLGKQGTLIRRWRFWRWGRRRFLLWINQRLFPRKQGPRERRRLLRKRSYRSELLNCLLLFCDWQLQVLVDDSGSYGTGVKWRRRRWREEVVEYQLRGIAYLYSR